MNGNLAYQDAFREELINGELVAMSPAATNHNRIARNISRIFGNYLLWKDCEPFGDGEAVFLSEEDRFIPDFMVVCDAEKIKWNGVHGAPDLVVEVLSPGTAKNDRGRKKDVYEKYGVREYWIVSPSEKAVEQYLLVNKKLVLHAVYTLHPDYVLADMTPQERAETAAEFTCSLYEDFVIRLEDIFYRAAG